MNTIITRPTITGATASCLLFLLYILLSHNDHSGSRWPAFYMPVVGILVVGGLLVVMARATMVTLITVFVMLACVGKRRRVLVLEGRKISSEVITHLFKVVIKERSVMAITCAVFCSTMAMVWVS
ncbi:hypothetical protein L2E82_46454 [Cichorium intybus]|uniref:Uncharacterized protein n=1 Tax=Cichorium intybus TaxID=13427 RepID=A0ACB8YUR0_CICIN|nr:hypothetical protein L2E82_46454 [Cichorium intybus]